MPNQYTKEMLITTGMCDHTGHLGIHQCFEQCMDIATVHAASLNLGISTLGKQHLFWLAVRTKIRFYTMPSIEDTVQFSTWPEAPARLRCNRCYRMTKDSDPVFEGKTEWAILNTESGALVRGDEVYPADMAFDVPSVFDEPFARVRDNFDGIEPYASYTVRSTDIDLGRHMNNAAYIRALCGTFTTEQLEDAPIRELDVRYVSQTREGETLLFQRRDEGEHTEIRVSAEGRTVLLASVIRRA